MKTDCNLASSGAFINGETTMQWADRMLTRPIPSRDTIRREIYRRHPNENPIARALMVQAMMDLIQAECP